jgi:hypothetical protein
MAVHWIVLLVAIIPFWLLQNIIHELAHGLALWFGWGWNFSIYPLPSMKLSRFTFAHVIYKPTATSETPTSRGWGLVSIMPRIVNGVFLMVAATLATFLQTVSPVSAVLCVLFAVCNLVDFSVGMVGIFRKEPNQSDIWRFQSYIGFDVYKLRKLAAISIFLGWVFLAIPTYLLLRV